MKKRVAAFLIAAAAAGIAGAAMSVRPMSVAQLTQESDRVVLADVSSISSAMVGDGMIYTYVTLDVRESWKGAAASRVVVRVPGGVVGGLRLHIPEAPRFAVGESVAVFLRNAADDWTASVETVGWFRGKFSVVGQSVRELRDTSVSSLRAQVEAASKG
jgi:hypothetical protein